MSTYAERMAKRQRDEAEREAAKAPSAAVAATAAPSEVEKTFSGFFNNLKEDGAGIAKGLAYPFQEPGEFFGGMKDLVVNEEGDFDLGGLYDAGGAVVDRYKEIASDPGQSLYDQPLSTAMDIASLAFPVRGAAKLLPDGSTVQKATEGAANVIQNMDPVSAATTGVAGLNAAVTNGAQLTETIIKPSNGRTHRESSPEYREQVMTAALERDITPNKSGMENLDNRISETGAQIDELLMASPVTIDMRQLVDGFEGWAKDRVEQTNNNWAAIRSKVEDKSATIKSQYATTPDGDPIVGISGEGLRKMRQSADGEVNYNRVNQTNEPAQVEVDRLYADYLREQLASKVDGISDLNAEMSTLLGIDDMYGPAYNRLNQNAPIGLGTVVGMSTGLPAMAYGLKTGDLATAAAGAAAVAGPVLNNPGVRGARAGSSHRSRRAGGANAGVPGPVAGLLGAAARDRNNVPFYLRQGGNALEGLFSEVSGEEER